MTLRFACRFWLVGQRNADGLYDVVFSHICRKEEFDFFLCVNKMFKGGSYALKSAPQAIADLLSQIPKVVLPYLREGVFQDEEKKPPPGVTQGSPYSDLTRDLGDRLTEYELVEDLIERGTLEENADRTMSIRLQ